MRNLADKLIQYQDQVADEIRRCHHDGKLAVRSSSNLIDEAISYNTPAITGDLRTAGEKIGFGESGRIIFSTTYLAPSQSQNVSGMLQKNVFFVGLDIEKSKIVEAMYGDPFTEETLNKHGRVSYHSKFPHLNFFRQGWGLDVNHLIAHSIGRGSFADAQPFYEVSLKIFIDSPIFIGVTIDSFSDSGTQSLMANLLELQEGYKKRLGVLIPLVIYNNQTLSHDSLFGKSITLAPNSCYVIPDDVLEQYGRTFTVEDFIMQEVHKRETYRELIIDLLQYLPKTEEYEHTNRLMYKRAGYRGQDIEHYLELGPGFSRFQHLEFRLRQYLKGLEQASLRINYYALDNDLKLAHSYKMNTNPRP